MIDQTRNIHIWKLTAKYDLEFDRTSLKCMGVVGWGDGARKLQCRGVLLMLTIVGQGFIVLSIGAGWGCLDCFFVAYYISFLSLPLRLTARKRLK